MELAANHDVPRIEVLQKCVNQNLHKKNCPLTDLSLLVRDLPCPVALCNFLLLSTGLLYYAIRVNVNDFRFLACFVFRDLALLVLFGCNTKNGCCSCLHCRTHSG